MAIITVVSFERNNTLAEIETMRSALNDSINDLKTDGSKATLNGDSIRIRIWATEESANAWIALVNSFSPAPIKSITLTV
jgi:hypothetical protein